MVNCGPSKGKIVVSPPVFEPGTYPVRVMSLLQSFMFSLGWILLWL
jgi:hypothetical protein